MPSAGSYTFGPFQFDAETGRLLVGDREIVLTDRQVALLQELVVREGALIPKDELVARVWGDVAVGDNSLEQMVSSLRRILREAAGDVLYVQTVPRRGYRLAVDVRRVVRRGSEDELDSLLAPYRAWLEGRAALEALDEGRIAQARAAFAVVIADEPDMAAAHVGMANACVMQFEATRVDRAPDLAALQLAGAHAREACRLAPSLAEAWATLGFVLARTHAGVDALAASRRAVTLEPDNWRHQLRLASVGWGEERLRAARRTQALLPGFPLAHWLAATVHIARHAFDEAVRELETGLAAAAGRPAGAPTWSAVALHGLRGLIHLAQGESAEALLAFDREIALEGSGHLYARESAARALYARAATFLRTGRREDAVHAFAAAVDRAPGFGLARAALSALGVPPATSDGPLADPSPLGPGHRVDAAIGRAVVLAATALAAPAETRALVCARLPPFVEAIDRALAETEPGSAGWWLPVDPLLDTSRDPGGWGPVLARLQARAS